MTESEPEKF